MKHPQRACIANLALKQEFHHPSTGWFPLIPSGWNQREMSHLTINI
jgi:hypothetical protein